MGAQLDDNPGPGKGEQQGLPDYDEFGAESYGYEAAKDWSRMIFHDLINTVGRRRRVPWDVLVCAVGTGGTITGVGELLKERKPGVRVVAVEPANAAVLSGKPAGNHLIPGIGVGFISEVLNRSILDEVIAVTDEDAFACTRRLAREEGILAGVSSGPALHAALAVGSREDAAGEMIVVVLADTGERYVTTSLFAPEQIP